MARRAAVLAPIRASLSGLGLLSAILTGAPAGTALLGWAVGAALMTIILAGDPRRPRRRDPHPLPAGAVTERWMEIARRDVFPSTVAVTIFEFIALPIDPVLAGVLAGVLGGMAIMTVAARLHTARLERHHGGTLFQQRGGRRQLFVDRPQD